MDCFLGHFLCLLIKRYPQSLQYSCAFCVVLKVLFASFSTCCSNCVGFQALIQYQLRQSAVVARSSLQVLFDLLLYKLQWTASLFGVSGGLVSRKIFNVLFFCRVVIFMMAAVSWTFNSQSRLWNTLEIIFDLWHSIFHWSA